MFKRQRGITLTNAIIGMILLALIGLFAAKLTPAYIEYFAVKKILATMEAQGDTKGSVTEIRNSFARRNVIENVQAVAPNDLEITKDGGEVVVTAAWSVKVPIVANFSACLDFTVSTAK
jgi:hypothetical protein